MRALLRPPPLSRRDLLLSSLAAGTGLVLPQRRLIAQEAAKVKKELEVHSQSPLNAEPELADLIRSRVSPVSHFYVRNHGPTPQIDADEYHLSIEGLVHKPLELTLDEVREKFPKQAVEATLTCAGNRRSEMSEIKPVAGVQWKAGAIGNAQWQGALLADLLKAAELKAGAKHVWFEGLDPVKEKDGGQAPFGGSVPLDRAIGSKREPSQVLAAWQMNGEPLAAEHGFPLRMVVPGFIGARSVKWLGKIVVSDRPSPNHYVAEAYKIVRSDDKAEVAAASPIYEYPVNAAICLPEPNARLKAGKNMIAGYALAHGDPACRLESVEVSIDGGQNWQAARFDDPQPFLWSLWSLEIDLPKGTKSLAVRARDNLGHAQPEKADWNLKGYLYNGWHRVKVEVV